MTECRSDGSLGGRAPKTLGPTYLNWSLPLVTGGAIMSVAGWPAKGSKIVIPPRLAGYGPLQPILIANDPTPMYPSR